MLYIKRDPEQTILQHLPMPEIIAILGPRQSGKTTLLRHIFDTLEKAVFLSFEDRKTLELFVEDEKTFAQLYAKNNSYLIIDEFQYAKEGGQKLKYIYDHYPRTKILISGSSAPGLTIHGIKYLVGRIFVFDLYPLSFEEFLRFKNESLFGVYLEKKEAIKAYLSNKGKLPEVSAALIDMLNVIYDEYLIFGGYPRVALAKTDDEKKTVLRNIYSTYFLREIKDLLGLTTDFNMSKLIKALSLQLGGLVSYNNLCEVSGFNYSSLLTHLNILEKTFICKRVLPFFTNKRTEIIKVPKIYFYDNGIRNIVIDDFRSYDLRQDIGLLNENFIFNQLTYAGMEVKFWRSKSRAEVDFVLDKAGFTAIESKSGGRSPGKSLDSFREKYKPDNIIVACKDILEERDRITYLPFVFITSIS